MPTPTQCQEATDAIDAISRAADADATAADTLKNSDDYKNGRNGARERYTELVRRRDNLRAVVNTLRGCDIDWDVLGLDDLGSSDPTRRPPRIRLNMTWKAMRTAAVAQVLAHEAIHVIMNTVRNSVDEEVACRRKEMEVWGLLKGNNRHGADLACENLERMFALGEPALRASIRGAYRNIPEHGTPRPPAPAPGAHNAPGTPTPRPPRKKSGHIKIESAHSTLPRAINFIERTGDELIGMLLGDSFTRFEYSFDLFWPERYRAYETEGSYETFAGLIGVGPKGPARGLSATIAIIEAPDVINGGLYATSDSAAASHVDALTLFNAEAMDWRVELIDNAACRVGGIDGRAVEAEYDIAFPHAALDDWHTRVHERAVFLQNGPVLYKISLVCEAAEWPERKRDLDTVLDSFVSMA